MKNYSAIVVASSAPAKSQQKKLNPFATPPTPQQARTAQGGMPMSSGWDLAAEVTRQQTNEKSRMLERGADGSQRLFESAKQTNLQTMKLGIRTSGNKVVNLPPMTTDFGNSADDLSNFEGMFQGLDLRSAGTKPRPLSAASPVEPVIAEPPRDETYDRLTGADLDRLGVLTPTQVRLVRAMIDLQVCLQDASDDALDRIARPVQTAKVMTEELTLHFEQAEQVARNFDVMRKLDRRAAAARRERLAYEDDEDGMAMAAVSMRTDPRDLRAMRAIRDF